MFRRFFTWLLISGLTFALVVACGDDDDKNDSDGGSPSGTEGETGGENIGASGTCYGDPGQTCPGINEFEQCVTTKCETQYIECFGANYMSGDFGGPCKDYMDCVLDCGCDTQCSQGCQTSADSACLECMAGNFSTCLQDFGCEMPVCTDSSQTEGEGGGNLTGNCATLAACCAKIAEAGTKTACNSVATAGPDEACSVNLNTFQMYCP